MAISNLISDAKQRMNTSVETVRRELATMRTGRASLSMLDNVRVDYYGTPTPLNQVGNLSTPDPTLIQVQPWDAKLLGVIEKAIHGVFGTLEGDESERAQAVRALLDDVHAVRYAPQLGDYSERLRELAARAGEVVRRWA